MKRRCYDKNAHNYQYYGAKGVTVHKAWRKSFLTFLEYMGKAPSSQHTLDRYPNPLGNYEPGNVRWATKSAQTAERNRRYKK